MRSRLLLAASTAALLSAFAATAATASETITYTYDAQGRVVKVVRSGTVNNGETIDYEHDDADNRTQKQTTGA